jgi:hypothetical protein
MYVISIHDEYCLMLDKVEVVDSRNPAYTQWHFIPTSEPVVEITTHQSNVILQTRKIFRKIFVLCSVRTVRTLPISHTTRLEANRIPRTREDWAKRRIISSKELEKVRRRGGNIFAYAFSKKHTIRMHSVESIICPDGVSGTLMGLLTGHDGIQYDLRALIALALTFLRFLGEIITRIERVRSICYSEYGTNGIGRNPLFQATIHCAMDSKSSCKVCIEKT